MTSLIVRLLQVKLLRRRKRLISAVTHGGVHLFRHRPDHFAGQSLVACLYADNSFPHVYLKLLAGLLPPSTRQPGPVAVLLGQMLKHSFIFSPISHFVGVDRETSSSCFSRVFLCIFYEEILNSKSYFLLFCCTGAMAIINVIVTDRKQAQYMKKLKKKNVQHLLP